MGCTKAKFLSACFVFILIVESAGLLPAFSEELPPLPPGPLLLTSVTPDQLNPDYWIKRLPNSDQLLLSPSQLKEFNKDLHAMVKDCPDLFAMGLTRSGQVIKAQISSEFKTLRNRRMWGVDNKEIPKAIFDQQVQPILGLEKIPSAIKLKWGAATRATSVRAVPSDVKMLEAVGDIEFDQLQFTLIKFWTPVAILHTSTDGRWVYIQAAYTRGWVKSKDIAEFSTRDELKKYVKGAHILAVTGESIPVFSDPALAKVQQRPSMGAVIPLLGQTPHHFTIALPVRGKNGKVIIRNAYVSAQSDVHAGFLPYTQANVIRQAFKLLGARYGWGGMYNGRDCSGFTQDVFLPFGIDMPRGSKEQIFAGTQLDHFNYKEMTQEKLITLHNASPGITLLRMPHHEMIYLGEVSNQFYVIHCTWAERYSMTSDAKNRINQVVVSDLNLNGKSHLGSLFDRIISMAEMV